MTSRTPLEGVVVLDVTQVMAGPFCTLLLADMGADVIKIEKPQGGDDSRTMGPPFIDGESAAFLAVNRNKRSIAIDLKSEEGRELFRLLARRSDVLVRTSARAPWKTSTFTTKPFKRSIRPSSTALSPDSARPAPTGDVAGLTWSLRG